MNKTSASNFPKRKRSDPYASIKILLCLGLSIHLSYYVLYYAFHDDTTDIADTELRKVVVNLTSINGSTYLDAPFTSLLAKQQRGRYEIPRIIHQSWNNYNIPVMTTKWVKRWRETNPDWTYVFWTDHSSREFIRILFPKYLELYDGFELPVQKADFFRYFVLWAIGGVYADLDVEPLRSLDTIAKESTCILSQEPQAHYRLLHPEFSTAENNFTLSCNAFMMCRNHHPYMAFLIHQIAERRAKIKTCTLPQTLLCTGPYIVSTSWVKYKSLYHDDIQRHPENDVICPDSDYFLPTWDPLRTGWIRMICTIKKRYDKLSESDKKICDKLKANHFQNRPQNWSYTNHHWFHSWTDERVRYLSKRYSRVHIFKVVADVIYGEDLSKV